MSKRFKTTDSSVNVSVSNAMIAKVGVFEFIADEEYPWVDIYCVCDETIELIEQVDTEKTLKIVTIEDLKIFSTNWYFNNVEIVKDVAIKEA